MGHSFLLSFIRPLLSTCCMPGPVLSSGEHSTTKADPRFCRGKFWGALTSSKPHHCPPGSWNKPLFFTQSPLHYVLHTAARGRLNNADVTAHLTPPSYKTLHGSVLPLEQRLTSPPGLQGLWCLTVNPLLTYPTPTPSRLVPVSGKGGDYLGKEGSRQRVSQCRDCEPWLAWWRSSEEACVAGAEWVREREGGEVREGTRLLMQGRG